MAPALLVGDKQDAHAWKARSCCRSYDGDDGNVWNLTKDTLPLPELDDCGLSLFAGSIGRHL